jgi:hypothetical protein
MTDTASFQVSAQAWQSFYLLAGGAAATLTGLMFVAVTFGASLVTRRSMAMARAFIDPTFAHFVQVLLTACLVVIPTMRATVLGALLLLGCAVRLVALRDIYGHLREAHRVKGDMEASDWASMVVLPLLCHVALAATGIGFLIGWAIAFDGLAVVTIALLGIGIFGAWESIVWIAVEIGERQSGGAKEPRRSDDRSADGNG